MAEPDLTSELEAAEDIVMGRAESVVTEWGVRMEDGRVFGMEEEGARSFERHRRQAGGNGTLVRRTVTYGPWEPAE